MSQLGRPQFTWHRVRRILLFELHVQNVRFRELFKTMCFEMQEYHRVDFQTTGLILSHGFLYVNIIRLLLGEMSI